MAFSLEAPVLLFILSNAWSPELDLFLLETSPSLQLCVVLLFCSEALYVVVERRFWNMSLSLLYLPEEIALLLSSDKGACSLFGIHALLSQENF